jgi:PKD repeat protein
VYDLPAPHDSPAAVAYDGDYDLVYLGFGLESVNDQASRRAALQAMVNWLGPCAVPALVPSFTSSSPDLIGSPTTFTNTTVGAEPISYAWDFGDGLGSSAEAHPVYTYTQVGSYTVWLTATNAEGSGAFSATVEITGAPPIAGFSHSAPVFLGSPVIFTNSTTPGQPAETGYLWDFGDGVGTSTAMHPVYTYTEVGTYTVWLNAANLAGSDAITADVQVLAPPETGFWVFLPLVLK